MECNHIDAPATEAVGRGVLAPPDPSQSRKSHAAVWEYRALPALKILQLERLPNAISTWKGGTSVPASHYRNFSLAIAITLIGIALAWTTCAHAALKELTADWTVELRAWVDSSPALAPDGTIYFGAFNGNFWALN